MPARPSRRSAVPRSGHPSRRWMLLAATAAGLLVAAAFVAAAARTAAPAYAASASVGRRKAPKRLLVVSVTKGFRHSSIPVAEETLKQMGETSGAFTVDYARTDEDLATKMTPDALKNYDGVFFANTTGDLPLPDRDAFIRWVTDGHALMGAHAASDTFHGFPPFIRLLGGEFQTHGPQVEVECRVEDSKHPATSHLAPSFKVYDEIYQFKNFERGRVHGLLSLDAHPNNNTPGDYPVAWSRREGKGRIFYTSLGHREDVWNAPWYRQHLQGGIEWALGLRKGDDKPQRK